MAAADQPSGLMEIASSLTQDEIPFKLRCAICNKLAVNAFRLPCCDQAICESCQESLPETCPVCAHTPLSSDLCKPNKALRTTLKAFLRTEEKKREKERQSATPAVANGATPLEGTPAQQDAPAPPAAPEEKATEEQPQSLPVTDGLPDQPPVEANAAEHQPHDVETGHDAPEETPAQDEQPDALPVDAADQTDAAPQGEPVEGDGTDENSAQPVEQDMPQDQGPNPMAANGMGFNMGPGGFPNMAWNNAGFNPMSQSFMGGGMFNFPNQMGMPGMAMDPMAANQGMMGGYGMNMNGMNNGMNMGMSYDAGQGMYGGWDGSQNNMWNGGQDKFNPNAFANGMGSQYGAPPGFGGYNMSQPNGVHAQMQHQQFPSQEFQSGFHGPGFGRGNFRGRGRGFFGGGRGRGGFPGSMQANYAPYSNHNSPSFNADAAGQSHDGVSPELSSSGDANMADAKDVDGADENLPGSEQEAQQIASSADIPGGVDGNVTESVPGDVAGDATTMEEDSSQLRGIPTIDSLDEANAHAMPVGPMGMNGPMGPGFGRGGYMRGRGGFGGPFMPHANMHQVPRVVPGVEGAPAAPRAMRQGLPNTSVLRQRAFHGQGRSPIPRPDASQSATPTAQEDQQPQFEPRSRSQSRGRSPSKPRSRSRTPPRSPSHPDRTYRQRSASVDRNTDDSEWRRERRRREDRRADEPAPTDDRRTRSPSVESRKSSYRRDRARDRRSDRRSRRAHRRSRSPSRNGDADRLSLIPEEKGTGSRSRTPAVPDAGESSSRRSGRDRPSRREEEREREKDSRRRDRDRNRDRERDRDRDRDRYRERERDRDKERDRDRDRRRARDKDRERDRKRSRRDRTASPAGSEYSSRHHSRRTKRSRDDDLRPSDRERTKDKSAKSNEPEKDPHTLEREARNRERLLKEQQRREAMQGDGGGGGGGGGGKSGRRRDSRQGRGLTGGRRLSYKYEDEENDDARAARVEKEREASRWA